TGEQRWRHGETERMRGLEIDGQLVFGRRLHRKVGDLVALEDAVDIAGGVRPLVGLIVAVAQQSAVRYVILEGIPRRQPVTRRSLNDRIALRVVEGARQHDQSS